MAIPVALSLDSLTDLAAYSYWIGLIVSLVVSSILYQLRLQIIMKRIK